MGASAPLSPAPPSLPLGLWGGGGSDLGRSAYRAVRMAYPRQSADLPCLREESGVRGGQSFPRPALIDALQGDVELGAFLPCGSEVRTGYDPHISRLLPENLGDLPPDGLVIPEGQTKPNGVPPPPEQ